MPERKLRQVVRAIRLIKPAVLVLMSAALGCASTDTAYNESPRKLSNSAPTAQEIETPLQREQAPLPRVARNGHEAVAQPTGDAVIPETATVRNEEIYGGAFPGLDADQSRGPGIEPPAPTQPAAEALAAQQELEQRLDALESRVADVANRPAPAPAPDTDAQARQAALEQRLRDAEEQLAELADRPDSDAEVTQLRAELEQRIAETEAKLGQMANQPPAAPAADADEAQATLERRLRELEVKLAAMEGQAPPERSENLLEQREEMNQRLAALESRLISVESRPVPKDESGALETARAQFDGHIQEMEARIAELEGRPPRTIETTPANFEDRFLEFEERLVELEKAENAQVVVPEAPAQPPAPPMAVDVHVADAASEDYLIGAGDMLEFLSFDDENLNRELTVRYDGRVSLPLIPDQNVANQTRAAAEDQLRLAYAKVFREPQLSLIVKEPASKTFLVMGDVATPGRITYTRRTSLVEAITLAGGLRQRNTSSSTGGFIGITGQLTKAFVVRHVNGQREVYEYDLRHMGQPGAHASEAEVYYGDIIYVPEGVNLVYLLGESRNPVIVELTEGMRLLQLLALSGGFDTSTAKLSSVVLLRQVSKDETKVMHMNVREMLKTGRDFPLQPGDIVYIPRKTLVRLEEFIARITGSITPVIDLYRSAVDAYYVNDLNRQLLDAGTENNTLRILQDIESFGTSTSNILDLYRRP